MTGHLILGVDPGLSGAFALYDPVLDNIATVIDIPTFKIKGKSKIDLYVLAAWVKEWAPKVKLTMIEQPGAMPGQGVASMFNFGKACGICEMAIAANFIRMQPVDPRTWKAAMKLTKDKDRSRQLASQMFPRQADLFARVKDDGRAEAILLAVYGAKFL